MMTLLRRSVPAVAIYLVLMVMAFASLGRNLPVPGDEPLHPVTGLVMRAAGALYPDAPGSGAFVVALVLHALAGGLLFALVYAWTVNRIVSLLAGALFVLHPALAPADPDSLSVILPSLLALAALLSREQAHGVRRAGGNPLPWEAVALGWLVLAALSGPVALALALLAPLAEIVFRRTVSGGHQRKRAAFCLFIYGATAFGAVLLTGPDAAADHGPAGGPAAGFRSLMLVPEGSALLPVANLMGLVLAAAGLGALLLGLRGSVSHPRWLLLHAGFGTAWFLACHAVALLPGVPQGDHGRALALAGPALVVPAAIWRAAMAFWTRNRERLSLPPSAQSVPDPLLLRETVRTVVAEEVHRDMVVEMTAALPAAVDSFLHERRAALGPGPSRLRVLGESWKRRQEEWQGRFGSAGQKALGGEGWSQAEREENLFAAYILPYLTPTSRVLQIGAAAPALLRLIVPEVFQVLCLESSRESLRSAQSTLAGLESVSFALSDGPGLGVVDAGCIDLIVSTDALLRLSQGNMYVFLLDACRVLRPGGRAILAFANLLDPEGFEEFERRVSAPAVNADEEPVHYLTPEIMRKLVGASGLRLESLHLGAGGRDMLGVVERPPSLA